MEQLVFIAVVLLFTILDGVARKKKQQALAEAQISPESDETVDRGSGPAAWTEPGVGVDPWVAAAGDGRHEEDSVSMTEGAGIPRDVWEEIAALASGMPAPAPPEPFSKPEVHPVEDPRAAPLPARPAHAVHESHEAYGTPVAARLSPLDKPSMHETPGVSGEIARVRNLLAGGGGSLRQAVILQELLGPPAALREDR